MKTMIVGHADSEDTREIYILNIKLEKIQKVLENPPAKVTDGRVFYEAALAIKIDLEAAIQNWWDRASKKYKLEGDTSIDFNTGDFSQNKD